MFSLSALMAQGAGAPSAPAPADRDDSGLIDLNALLGEASASTAAAMVPARISVSMFDIPAAPPAEITAIAPDAATKKLAHMWQTVAAFCALGLVVAIAVAASRPASQDHGAAAMQAVPAAVVPAQPALDARTAAVEPPTAPSLSEEPPAARAEPPKVAAPIKATKTTPRSTSNTKNRSETPAKKKEEKKEDKKPAVDPCNGDLRCAMERSLR